MKKILFTSFMVTLLVMSGSAFAGGMKSAVYLGGGAGMPLGTFGDLYKSGFGGAAGFTLEVSPGIQVGLTGAYTSFGFDEDGVMADYGIDDMVAMLQALGADVDITTSGGGASTLEILADVRYLFMAKNEEAKFQPYMVASVGMTRFEIDEFTIEACAVVPGLIDTTFTETGGGGSTSDATLGFGGGFEYGFSPTAAFWLDLRYMTVMTEGESLNFVPIRAGVKFSFGGTGE